MTNLMTDHDAVEKELGFLVFAFDDWCSGL
jgi:hypothetical protein